MNWTGKTTVPWVKNQQQHFQKVAVKVMQHLLAAEVPLKILEDKAAKEFVDDSTGKQAEVVPAVLPNNTKVPEDSTKVPETVHDNTKVAASSSKRGIEDNTSARAEKRQNRLLNQLK